MVDSSRFRIGLDLAIPSIVKIHLGQTLEKLGLVSLRQLLHLRDWSRLCFDLVRQLEIVLKVIVYPNHGLFDFLTPQFGNCFSLASIRLFRVSHCASVDMRARRMAKK